jgi:hypothetical protein
MSADPLFSIDKHGELKQRDGFRLSRALRKSTAGANVGSVHSIALSICLHRCASVQHLNRDLGSTSAFMPFWRLTDSRYDL